MIQTYLDLFGSDATGAGVMDFFSTFFFFFSGFFGFLSPMSETSIHSNLYLLMRQRRLLIKINKN